MHHLIAKHFLTMDLEFSRKLDTTALNDLVIGVTGDGQPDRSFAPWRQVSDRACVCELEMGIKFTPTSDGLLAFPNDRFSSQESLLWKGNSLAFLIFPKSNLRANQADDRGNGKSEYWG